MNCIKCGREIPDGELFCVACSLSPTVQDPGAGAARPARSSKPPKIPDTRAAAKADRPAARKARGAAEHAPRRSKKPAIALVIVSLLLAGSLTYIIVNFGGLAVERRRLRAKEADLILRETEIEALEKEQDALTRQLSEAQTSIAELEQEIETLQEQLNSSQSTVSQSQYDMTSQQHEMDKLTGENAELLSTVGDLEGQITQLTAQLNQLTASNATYSAKASFMDSYVVFVNNDGSKLYHKYDCPDFTRQSFWAYSRKLAESNGYSPCSKCN